MSYVAPEAPLVFDFPADEVRAAAEQRLSRFAAGEFPGLPVNKIVDEGDPGSCIAELAKSREIDLIMLPTRGRGRFRAALLGSVTAKTLHDAECAVWTEAHCEDAGATHADWRTAVCGIDTVPEGLRLIRFASELAASTGVKVCLAHAIAATEAEAGEYLGPEFMALSKDRASQAISAMQHAAGTNFDICVEIGNIPGVVRHAAESHKADVVLIGRGALPHFAGRLRSHAYAIVRDMPCPVLSV
jgi:nucleotide-binding universal stress UspA family protein